MHTVSHILFSRSDFQEFIFARFPNCTVLSCELQLSITVNPVPVTNLSSLLSTGLERNSDNYRSIFRFLFKIGGILNLF